MNGGIDAAIYGQEALGDRGGLPAESSGGGHAFESLKTASILDTGYRDVHVEIAVFSDWEQGESYHVTVPAGRAKHLRFNDLGDTGRPQRGIDDASLIEAKVSIIAKHTRLDLHQPALTLLAAARCRKAP